MCHITVIYLPTSPAYCCYTTLGNIGYSSKALTKAKSHVDARKTDALSLSGCTSLIFVDPGTKADGSRRRMMQQMLPSIRSVAVDAYAFQQDSAPAHRAHRAPSA